MCEHYYYGFKKEMKTIFGTAVQWGASSLRTSKQPTTDLRFYSAIKRGLKCFFILKIS